MVPTDDGFEHSLQQVIAVVDDDDGVRRSMKSLLHSIGYRAETYADAGMLLKQELSRFCLVISDLQMPGMNGLDLQGELARRSPDLPFLLMTAFPEPSLRQRALAAGARALFEKPCDIDELVDLIATTVGPPVRDR